MDFRNKIAIVTGGAQGIGKSIVQKLVSHGAYVVIADLNIEKANQVKEELKELGNHCDTICSDIGELRDIEKLVNYTLGIYGKIDILVNNAGIAQQIDILDLTEEDYEKVMKINLKSMIFLSQKVIPSMIKQCSGKIINIASLAGERGGLFAGIHYSTSKAGVIVATKCLALKAGKYNINVNAVAPGLIATDMGGNLDFNTDEVAMGRLGTADEVADGVLFLASNMSNYITGATLDINGGIFMR